MEAAKTTAGVLIKSKKKLTKLVSALYWPLYKERNQTTSTGEVLCLNLVL